MTLKQQYEDYRIDADNRGPGADSMTFAEWCEATLDDAQRTIQWSHVQLNNLGVDQNMQTGAELTLIGRLGRLTQQITLQRDTLTRAYTSNAALHQAFNIYPPQPRQAGRLVDEEAGELREALAAAENDAPTLEECADVIYTLMGVLHSRGFTLPELAKAVEAKCATNDLKRPQNGWGLNSKGKIAKVTQ